MLMQNFGGQIRCIYGKCGNGESEKFRSSRDCTPVRPSALQAYQCNISQLTAIRPQATGGVLAENFPRQLFY